LLKVLIRTTDTDVLVLAIAHFHKIEAAELWVVFGSGKTFQYIPAHDIAVFLGQEKAWAFLAFHAFTGCDTVSFLLEEERRQLGAPGKLTSKQPRLSWPSWTDV